VHQVDQVAPDVLHHASLNSSQIIPSSLVRRLALRKLQLTEEDDEDDDNDNLAIAAVKGASGQETMSG
jgi:hypothetical protein